MMPYAIILAEAVETAGQTPQPAEQGIVPIDLLWQQITSLGLLEALTFISFGVVCLFYGWRIFRILVVISFALIGLFAGIWVNKLLVGGSNIWMGIICMVLFAVFSMPLVRWAVCVLGAIAGAVLTGGGWFAVGLPEQYIWAGAIIGAVAGGMISFIIFKAAVMLFTSLGGSSLVVTGLLALLYQYSQTTERVNDLVHTHNWFLPLALLIPTAAGIVAQHKFIKGAKNWNI